MHCSGSKSVVVEIDDPDFGDAVSGVQIELDAAVVVRFFRHGDGTAYTDIIASQTPRATPVAALPGMTIDLAGLLA